MDHKRLKNQEVDIQSRNFNSVVFSEDLACYLNVNSIYLLPFLYRTETKRACHTLFAAPLSLPCLTIRLSSWGVSIIQSLYTCKFFFEMVWVSSSIIQNSTTSSEVLLFARNFFVSCTNISAHLSLGDPKIPELISANKYYIMKIFGVDFQWL